MTTRIHATNISLRYADDEKGKPAETDGQFFEGLTALERANGGAPVDGRTARVTLSNGEVHEADANGEDWAIDFSTNASFETLAAAVDHLEVWYNERNA